MKKLIVQTLAVLFIGASAHAQKITIVYPPEGAKIPSVAATFVFGNITPPDGKLLINDELVKTHTNGGFITFLPVRDGDFQFYAEMLAGTMTATAVRNIKVGEPDRLPKDKEGLDELSITPSSDMKLRAGDWLNVSARATPGLTGTFTVKHLAEKIPLIEMTPGRYAGSYQIQPGQECQNEQIKLRFDGKDTNDGVAKGLVTVDNGPFDVAVATGEFIPLRSAPSGDYIMFAQEGTPLVISGQQEGKSRVYLSDTHEVWVDNAKLAMLPKGTRIPQDTLWAIKTVADSTSTHVRIYTTIPPLFSVEEEGDGLNVDFYYSKTHVDTIVYDPADAFIKGITFRQTGGQTARVKIKLDPKTALWGYDAVYANGYLNIELRRPPVMAKRKALPLAGLKIVLDPGHSTKTTPPFDGAVGPMGHFEPDATIALAKDLRPVLEKLGAVVVQTREGDEEVKLASRSKTAWENRGDIFVSLHYNAIPDGENPFAKPKGFSVYYTQPHSMTLAKALHDAYKKDIHLADESFRYKDLSVTRMTQMPAALIESAHLIMPEQEEMAFDPQFRKKLAATIAKGILEYFDAPTPQWLAEIINPPAPKPAAPAKPVVRKRKPAPVAPAAVAVSTMAATAAEPTASTASATTQPAAVEDSTASAPAASTGTVKPVIKKWKAPKPAATTPAETPAVQNPPAPAATDAAAKTAPAVKAQPAQTAPVTIGATAKTATEKPAAAAKAATDTTKPAAQPEAVTEQKPTPAKPQRLIPESKPAEAAKTATEAPAAGN